MQKYMRKVSVLVAFAIMGCAAVFSMPALDNDTRQELRLGVGDLVSVAVFDCPELSQDARIAADGTIHLALLGDLPVQGLTPTGAARVVELELRDKKMIREPQVNLAVKEYATQAVTVAGEVQRPGLFPVYGPRTLFDVLAMAGGVNAYADVNVTIKRKDNGATQTVVVHQDNGTETADAHIAVFPGDTVVVPRAGIVYVLGDVARPGGFVMHDNGKMTLMQALAEAQGAQHTASLRHAVWIRKTETGLERRDISLKQIMNGKEPDMQLAAGDILYVPVSAMKTLMGSTSGIVSSASGASIYALTR